MRSLASLRDGAKRAYGTIRRFMGYGSRQRVRPQSDSGNLVLIGMRACGKTQVGRTIAERARRPFLDLDEALAETAGRNCDMVLAEEGESGFRGRERVELAKAADLHDHVVATGGGAVLCGEAFDALARPATVVYLDLPLEILIERSLRRPRPALTSLSPAAEVAALLVERDPLYRAAADMTISVGAQDPILAVLDFWPLHQPDAQP